MSTLMYKDAQLCADNISVILDWLKTNPQPGGYWAEGVNQSLTLLFGVWKSEDEAYNYARLSNALAKENFLGARRICEGALNLLSPINLVCKDLDQAN